MTPEQTSDFYAEHYGKMFFPSLVAYMSSGPVLALVLARQSAISYWRQLIGPTNTQKARDQAPERYCNIMTCSVVAFFHHGTLEKHMYCNLLHTMYTGNHMM